MQPVSEFPYGASCDAAKVILIIGIAEFAKKE
jgi:hypothetical protein